MEVSKTMEKVLNEQILAEFSSAYLYLSMSAWFEGQNLPGCAHWMKKQSGEEMEHAMKLFDYLPRRGGCVTLGAVPAPKHEWKNATQVFEETLAHEKVVTRMICALMEQARQEKDYATENFIAWFVDEQVEEEDTAAHILDKFQKLGEVPISLAMLDRELATR